MRFFLILKWLLFVCFFQASGNTRKQAVVVRRYQTNYFILIFVGGGQFFLW